jgi:hypothetical protein
MSIDRQRQKEGKLALNKSFRLRGDMGSRSKAGIRLHEPITLRGSCRYWKGPRHVLEEFCARSRVEDLQAMHAYSLRFGKSLFASRVVLLCASVVVGKDCCARQDSGSFGAVNSGVTNS